MGTYCVSPHGRIIILQGNAKNGEENENEEILILNGLETSDVDASTSMWRSQNSSTEGIWVFAHTWMDVDTMEEKISWSWSSSPLSSISITINSKMPNKPRCHRIGRKWDVPDLMAKLQDFTTHAKANTLTQLTNENLPAIQRPIIMHIAHQVRPIRKPSKPIIKPCGNLPASREKI